MNHDNLLHYKGYSAKPEYSVEDKLFYGTILGIDDLVDFSSEDARKIEDAFHAAVDDYLAFCADIGKEPQKEYSGMFHVRISPDLHKKLMAVAKARGVTLNTAVEQAIAEYV